MKIMGNKIILSVILISLLFISGFTDAITTNYDNSLKSNLDINKGVKSIEKISDNNSIILNNTKDIDLNLKYGIKLIICNDLNDKSEGSFKSESKIIEVK